MPITNVPEDILAKAKEIRELLRFYDYDSDFTIRITSETIETYKIVCSI